MQTIEKAGAQSADSPFTFVLSTEDVDRMGDVVVQAGINLREFKRNPIALFGHSQRVPIGTWENIRRDGAQLLADLKFAARGTSRMVDELRSFVEQRILRAASIGFGVQKSEPLDPEHPYGGQRYLKTDLLEASLVAVPANANALMLRDLSPETRALFADERGIAPDRSAELAATAASRAIPRRESPMENPKSIPDKIKAARDRLVAIDARSSELETLALSVDSLTDAQTQEVADLAEERKTTEKNIENLSRLDELIRQRAQPVNAPQVITRTQGRGNEAAGMILARMALATVYARVEQRSVLEIARERFPHDQRIEAVFKAATPTADTTTAGWAKELVRTDVKGFVESLVPTSVYAALSSRALVLDFGDAGSISVPYRGGTNTDVAGSFVGENGVIPVKRATIAATLLNRYKMAVISTLTKELSRVSTPQAEGLIRRFIADDTSVALDKAFLDAIAAVPGVRPAGILAGVAAIPASVLATPIEKALADLKALITAMTATGNGLRPVLLINPAQRLSLAMLYSNGTFVFKDELAGNSLMGADVIMSANVPAGDLILIDAAAFATGLGTPEFDSSDTATLVMADAGPAAPTHATGLADRTIIGTAEQVPPDGGISVYDAAQRAAGKAGENAVSVSMFQQWGIALRTVLPVSWAMTRPGAVHWVDNVGW